MSFPDRCLFCIFSLLNLISLVSAQLTGSIYSPGNPFLVIVNITNPTTNHVSILRWNNIFDDETQLPVSLRVEDDAGGEVQIASTYAMRSGMTNNDIYTIEPQGSFLRNFDLRDTLQSISKGRSSLQKDVVQFSLPPVVSGILHQGSYSVPPEAAADLSAQEPRLGNFSAAGLGDIALDVRPLRLAFRFPIFDTLSGNETGPPDGVQPNASQCMTANVTGISDAIFDARVYANSIQMASKNPTSTLFESYFRNETRAAVEAIASSVGSSLQGSGPHVDLYCSGAQGLCNSSSNIMGYTFTPSWLGNAFVVLCPSAINLGRAPAACSTPAGSQASASTSHVLIHLMLTLNNIVGKVISNSIYGSLACQGLLRPSGNGPVTPDPLRNADSFAQLAISLWEYGLGGPPYTGATCLPSANSAPTNNKRSLERDDLDQLQSGTSQVEPMAKRQDMDSYLDGIVAQAQECRGAQLAIVQNAVENARALAGAARNSTDPELWKQYVGSDRITFFFCFSSESSPIFQTPSGY